MASPESIFLRRALAQTERLQMDAMSSSSVAGEQDSHEHYA
jgi:hypothetical protein